MRLGRWGALDIGDEAKGLKGRGEEAGKVLVVELVGELSSEAERLRLKVIVGVAGVGRVLASVV